MQIFWWNGGLHVEPETDSDRYVLMGLTAALRIGHRDASLQSETASSGGPAMTVFAGLSGRSAGCLEDRVVLDPAPSSNAAIGTPASDPLKKP
jgi:hypothetical protein